MSRSKPLILVVDDETRYVLTVKYNLEASGYDVITASDGKTAIELVATHSPDVVLLDVKMPAMDGMQVCKLIRQFSNVPVIMLTALASERDKVNGLDSGADDYVTKPFGASELMARVRAALRRQETASQTQSTPSIRCGELEINLLSKRVFIGSHEVKLTPTEFRLLCEFGRNSGRVLVPDYLLERVWGINNIGDENLLWKVIHRLRKKIEPDPQKPRYILTRPGIGYYFCSSDEKEDNG